MVQGGARGEKGTKVQGCERLGLDPISQSAIYLGCALNGGSMISRQGVPIQKGGEGSFPFSMLMTN